MTSGSNANFFKMESAAILDFALLGKTPGFLGRTGAYFFKKGP